MTKRTIIIYFLLIILTSCENRSKAIQSLGQSEINDDKFAHGKKLLDEEKYQEAITVFSSQIELTPRTATLYAHRAMAYSEIEKYDSAINDMNIAIELSPTDISLFFLRGQLKYNGGYFKDALTDFDSVQFKDNEFTDLWVNKGVTYLKLGMRKQACGCFSTGIKYRQRDAAELFNRECN